MLRMLALVALTSTLVACGPSYRDIAKIDTIEAYETWLASNPNHANAMMARIRVEELYLENARELASLEGFDLYLEKYPEGSNNQLRDKVIKEREEFLYKWADDQNTAEAWESFLEQYPKARRERKIDARKRIKVLSYIDNLEFGPVEIEAVNLAENPDGPLDGFAWRADITNKGNKAIITMNMKIEHLNAEGRVIESDKWPVVGPHGPNFAGGYLPMPEEWKKPIQPGETRLYEFTDMAPESPGWARKARLRPLSITLEGEDEKSE